MEIPEDKGGPGIECLGIHVDYELLKANDLIWLFGLVNRGVTEVIHKNRELSGDVDMNAPRQKRPQLIIDSVSTEKSVDIVVLLLCITGAITIVEWGRKRVEELYDHIKKGSADKRYIGKRKHLKVIKVRRLRIRHIPKMEVEILDEFELEIKSS